jgi:hypothetical protein
VLEEKKCSCVHRSPTLCALIEGTTGLFSSVHAFVVWSAVMCESRDTWSADLYDVELLKGVCPEKTAQRADLMEASGDACPWVAVVAAIFAELLLWGDSLRCESISGFFPPFTQNLCFRVDKRVTSFPDHGGMPIRLAFFFSSCHVGDARAF